MAKFTTEFRVALAMEPIPIYLLALQRQVMFIWISKKPICSI